MSETHEPHSQSDDPGFSARPHTPEQANQGQSGQDQGNTGWNPPPPRPDWAPPSDYGGSWKDPSSWAHGEYGNGSPGVGSAPGYGQTGSGHPGGQPSGTGYPGAGTGGTNYPGGGAGYPPPGAGYPPPAGGYQQPGGTYQPSQPSGGGYQPPAYGPGQYGYGPYGQDRGWTPPPPPPPWGANPYGGGSGSGGGGWSYGWSPARPHRSLPSAVTALLLVVAVLVGLGIGHGVWRSAHNAVASGGSGNSQLPNGNNGGNNFNPFGNGSGANNGGTGVNGGGSLSGVTATVANELVDINTTLSYQNDEAAGTGIVLTSDGYVLTNNHVISGATSIKATDIGNGQTYTATVVGYDRTHDVAVIKLANASGLKTAKLGDSTKLSVGEAVIGIGNAGGVGGTPSPASGHITALNQSITAQDESNGTSEKLTGLVQTDANIQPGDSGGALIDANGDVIGVDTAASTGFSFQTQGNQGFAIPINEAVTVSDIIRSGQTTSTVHIGKTAFLGVEIDTSAAAANNGGATISSQGGGVLPNSPAAQAGLQPGDVITSVGGSAVTSASALTTLMIRYHPGDKVAIAWTDANGQSHQATVTLADGPPQ